MFPLTFNQVSFFSPDSNKALIDELDLRIEKAGTLAVLGPNGAGKSLFLRLAHRLLKPTKGQITWAEGPAVSHAQAQQSMVFQQPVMLRRSAAANLDYALRLKGVKPAAQRRELVRRALGQVGLLDQLDQDANTLSLGERQRLAIARAIISKPAVIFLDEPTASLDPNATHQIETILTATAQTQTKLIFATHDLMQAKRLADQVLFLHRGKLVEYSAASTFFEQPESALAAQFIAGELLYSPSQAESTPS